MEIIWTGSVRIIFSDINIKNNMLELADTTKTWARGMLIINLFCTVMGYFSGEYDSIVTEVGNSNFFSYLLEFFLIYVITRFVALALRKILFPIHSISYKAKYNIIIVSSLTIGVIIMILTIKFAKFIEIPAWVEMVICVIYLGLYYVLNRKNIKIKKSQPKKKFFEHFSEQVDLEYNEEMQKMFEKENRKLARRGKPEMTMSDFVAKIEKNYRTNQKLIPFYLVMPAVIMIGVTLVMVILNQFETHYDIYFFAIIIIVCEYIIFIPLYKLVKIGQKKARNWLDNFDKSQLDENKLE